MDGEVRQLEAVGLVFAKQYIVDTNTKRSHSYQFPPINGNTKPLVKTKSIGLAYWSIDGDRISFKSIYWNVEYVV